MRKKYFFPFSALIASALSAVVTIGCAGMARASGIALPENSGLPMPPETSGLGPVVDVVSTVLNWLLAAFLLLAIIAFIITGLQYLLSFGNTYVAENAKRNFIYSIVAVAIVCAALIIISTINMLLHGDTFLTF